MPGDGAFGMAMEHLRQMGWIEPLKKFIASGGYFFGICLGFQLLFSSSDEFGFHEGLNIIPGHVRKFDVPGLKVPHMGWNDVDLIGKSKFFEGIDTPSYFYFIHSFYPVIEDHSWSLGDVTYGDTFSCIVGKDNMIATQFHPEKSHHVGLKIVENFVRHSCL